MGVFEYSIKQPSQKTSTTTAPSSPYWYTATLQIARADQLMDTHLDLSAATNGNTFGKGVAVVTGNGVTNLGRYWVSQGPQHSLYLPAPFLRVGANTISVLEFEKPGNETAVLEFTRDPDYLHPLGTAETEAGTLFA